MSYKKPQAKPNHTRKASVGVISPSQNSSSLIQNRLIFSGSQLATLQDATTAAAPSSSGNPPTLKENLSKTQPV